MSPCNGETKQGYLWTCKRPGADTSYTWATSRAANAGLFFVPASKTIPTAASSAETSGTRTGSSSSPPKPLLANSQEGIERFIRSVKDIKLFI